LAAIYPKGEVMQRVLDFLTREDAYDSTICCLE
jgi:hypothetical protein